MTNEDLQGLIEEPKPLRAKRRGGAVNLLLAGLLLETARMVDEGTDPAAVEEASRLTFGTEKGFLTSIAELGVGRLANHLSGLVEAHSLDDALTLRYDNFFKPPGSLSDPDRLRVPPPSAEPIDPMVVHFLGRRFRGVAYMIAAEVVDSEILEPDEMDRAVREALLWTEGPFAMMNSEGLDDSLKLVTERMEMSHRKEINFPIPKSLLIQVQKNAPWPVERRLTGRTCECDKD